jgi:hypothetical protein
MQSDGFGKAPKMFIPLLFREAFVYKHPKRAISSLCFSQQKKALNIDCRTFCIVNRQFHRQQPDLQMRKISQEEDAQKQALRVSVPTTVKSHKFNAMGSLPPLTKT